MQGGAQPHALNALVLGFVLRLRQHRRQALGGSFRQGPWCSHAKPPASASLPLFMIVRKRISMITTRPNPRETIPANREQPHARSKHAKFHAGEYIEAHSEFLATGKAAAQCRKASFAP